MTNINDVISSIVHDFNATTDAVTTTSTTGTTTSTSSTTTTSTTKATVDTKTSVGKYVNSTSAEDLDAKTIFKKLSIDVGGDGKEITKDQLDAYVAKAEKGTVKLGSDELKGLKEIQKDWEKVSDGGDSITLSNVSSSGYTDALTSMKPEETTTPIDVNKLQSDIKTQIDNYLMNSALESGSTDTKSGLSDMLNSLLKGTTDVNDAANANLIDTLTNMIAGYSYTQEYKA